MGSISYIMEGLEKFLPCEFLYAFWYQEIGPMEADVTLCLESGETGEIRELWYKRVDQNTEYEVLNKEFKKFFNEHYGSLKGRKHVDSVLDSSLLSERWIPDGEHRRERLALYRRVEKHGYKRIAAIVLVLEDCDTGKLRELWHTAIKLSHNVTDHVLKGKLEKIVEEHYAALKGREVILVTISPASENSEFMERGFQKPGSDNKGNRGTKILTNAN